MPDFVPGRELARAPHEIWLWLLACQWRRIDQEEPFVGRAAEADDEIGARRSGTWTSTRWSRRFCSRSARRARAFYEASAG